MTFHCFNCHKEVQPENYSDITYKEYAMFVCEECMELLEKESE